MLAATDLSRRLSKSEYRVRIPRLQRRLHELQRACWEQGLATVVVFEGWDAAGKGTTIRKLTQRLEPRGFSLHAIRAARTTERHLPWMWRFWIKVPNWGEMAIFDRSWYGRVLVERVEGLTDETEWRRAFEDIVSFERELVQDRYVIVKFFLHLSEKEQKRRFEALESDPATAWQVEAEDWEHHAHYDEYRAAADEMLERTGTAESPWTVVEAADRRWVRAKVFRKLVEAMEAGLADRGCAVPPPEATPEELEPSGGDR